jgi:hypothetical protein
MARWKYVEVEVDLNEFDTDDLIEEIESRGYVVLGETELSPDDDDDLELRKIYDTKKIGGNVDQLLADYLYRKLGVIL